MLLVLVVLSMSGSPISVYEVGLTADNWKSALGIGVMFSLLPLGLSQLLLSNVPPEVARKEAESRGPVATWCGLIVLGSFSYGLWSAFCIVALIRLGFSAWLAVAIPALFSATASLQVSIARALGAAAFGGAAGFLFVNTGSLLAPLAMGIIGGVANLYYVRHACSAVRPQFSRYSKPCPICGEVIRLTKVRWAGDMITCPKCGECLTTKKKYLWAIGAVSILLAAYATRQFVHRDPDWVLIAEGVALVLFFELAFCFSLIVPPGLKRVRGKAFDKALSLFGTDQRDGDKKQARR
jgi:predicted RNA-binding Zn-ribbon protein involved in translation (DUF1610 family)